MAAMGAEPVCLLAAVGVPAGYAAVADLAAGMAEHGVAARRRRSLPQRGRSC